MRGWYGIGLLLVLGGEGSAQAPSPSPALACEALQAESPAQLVERDRLITYDARSRPTPTASWRELGCVRFALDALGQPAREGVLMPAGETWRQGAINAFLRVLRAEPADSIALVRIGQVIVQDWYADSLGAIATTLLRGARQTAVDPSALRGCVLAAQWARDTTSAAGCARLGLASGKDLTFHHVAGARLTAAVADTAATMAHFEGAMGAVATPEDRELVRGVLQWFVAPDELVTFDSLPFPSILPFVRDVLARRDVRDGRAPGARLMEHYRRLAYAEVHFLMKRPKADRERLRTLPAVVIFPDGMSDKYRTLRLRNGMSDASEPYSPNAKEPTDAPALPWREYRRWQVDLDDRGIVHLRFGAPEQRIPFSGSFLAREVWMYHIDGEKMLLSFEREDFSGSAQATRLVTGVLGDYFCDVDVRRCLESGYAVRGLLKPENLATIKSQDREFLATATTKDDNSLRTPKVIRIVASAHTLWHPRTGAPVTLYPYAIRLGDLERLPGDSLLAPIMLAGRSWDSGAGTWRDSSLTRQLLVPKQQGGGAYITGVIALAGASGASSWSITAAQGSDRSGRYHAEGQQPLASGPLALSDVILGDATQNLTWRDGELAISMAPLQGVARKSPVSMYVQVRSAVARTDGVEVEVNIVRPATASKAAAIELTVRSRRALTAGLNEILQEIDVSRLDEGEYALEMVVRHAATGATDRRQTRLVIR